MRVFAVAVALVGLSLSSPSTGLAADGKGTFSGFGKHPHAASKRHSFQTVRAPEHPVREGRKSFRFEVRDGDCGRSDCRSDRERVERSERRGVRPGSEHWYSWSVYLDPSFQGVPRVPIILGQFKQEPVGPQIMALEVEGNRLVFLMKHLDSTQGRCCKIDATVGNVSSARGGWIDLVMHVRWSNGGDGFLNLYRNGRRIVAHQGSTTYLSDRPVTFRYGVYRSSISRHAGTMPTQIVYFDNIKRGKSQAEVMP